MAAPNKPYTFGLPKACSEEQLVRETAFLYSSCTLQEMGSFYFAHALKADGNASRAVYLKFYDNKLGLLHTSLDKCFHAEPPISASSPPKVLSMAVNPHVFFLRSRLWQGVCLLDNSWTVVVFQTLENEDIPKLASFIKDNNPDEIHLTSVHKTGLAKIRDGTPGDFHLTSEDGQKIEVHKTVLQPLWPFFSATIDSNMMEATENSLDLPFPASTIEVAVRYLYGQPLEFGFGDAANLLVMAQMYDLPELLSLAVAKIKAEALDVQQAIMLWKKSFEACNDDLRSYSAARIKQMMPDISHSKQLDDLDRDEMVALFMDVSGVESRS